MFLSRHSTVRLTVEELSADGIAECLDAGKIDFGITYRPEHRSDLRFEPLFNEELMLVVGSAHPLACRKRIRMIELHHQPLVLLPRSFATRRMLDECCAAAGAMPNVVLEMNTIAAMLGVAERIPIGTIVAANAVSHHSSLRVVPLENPTPIRTTGLLFHADWLLSRPVRAFAELVRKQAMESTLRPKVYAAVSAQYEELSR